MKLSLDIPEETYNYILFESTKRGMSIESVINCVLFNFAKKDQESEEEDE